MCIICVSEYDSDSGFDNLPGYEIDKSKVSDLFEQLGFDVYFPICGGKVSLKGRVSTFIYIYTIQVVHGRIKYFYIVVNNTNSFLMKYSF